MIFFFAVSLLVSIELCMEIIQRCSSSKEKTASIDLDQFVKLAGKKFMNRQSI